MTGKKQTRLPTCLLSRISQAFSDPSPILSCTPGYVYIGYFKLIYSL